MPVPLIERGQQRCSCYLRTGQGWAELKGEEPGKAGRVVLFFKAFHTFLRGEDHTEGRQGGNYNPWFRLSYTGKDTFLVGSHAKKEKKTHLQLAQTPFYEPAASLLVSIPSNGHAWPVRLHHVEPTSQEPLPPKPLPFGRLQNNIRH